MACERPLLGPQLPVLSPQFDHANPYQQRPPGQKPTNVRGSRPTLRSYNGLWCGQQYGHCGQRRIPSSRTVFPPACHISLVAKKPCAGPSSVCKGRLTRCLPFSMGENQGASLSFPFPISHGRESDSISGPSRPRTCRISIKPMSLLMRWAAWSQERK